MIYEVKIIEVIPTVYAAACKIGKDVLMTTVNATSKSNALTQIKLRMQSQKHNIVEAGKITWTRSVDRLEYVFVKPEVKQMTPPPGGFK